MNAYIKKLAYVLSVAAFLTVGAANVFAAHEPHDRWYKDGPMLQQNEFDHFISIESGGSDQ